MEIVITFILLCILCELTIIVIGLAKLGKQKMEEETEEAEHKGRRDTQGVFANPLGDSYRKNKGLYVPIKPGSVMLDGDEEDEV